MKTLQQAILFLLVISATGCSSFRFNLKNDLTYVDELIKRDEYAVALKFIDKQPKNSPDYKKLQKRRPALIKKSDKYQQHILEKSKKLVDKKRWSDSIELLEDASTHVHNNKAIRKELQRQKTVRDKLYSKLKYQLIIHEANSIKQDRALYKRLVKLDSRTPMSPDISTENIQEVTQELLEWAEFHTQAKETVKARKSLKLAGEIKISIRKSARFRSILRQITKVEKGISKAIKKKRQQALEKQIDEFNHLFDQNNLIDAQQALKDIEKRFGKTAAIKKLRKRINIRVAAKIKRHMDKGNGFYSKEQIEHAITEWGHVLQLDPDNQKALENISRAVNVLEQLQKVRANQKR